MKIITFILVGISILVSHLLGFAMPILTVVNFAFLLFKDAVLFPWIYLLWMVLGFIASIILGFLATLLFVVSD